MERLRIGSRGSALALTQSRWVKDRILASGFAGEIEIEVIRTTGDERLDAPLPEIGGKGVFTKEIDEALLSGSIDLAVHSLKDLPTRLETGLSVSCVPLREDPRDVLVTPPGVEGTLDSLPAGARVGTSSIRRGAFLRLTRPDLEVTDIRGNLDTRLRKLDEGLYDALVLAGAGLIRLGLADRIDQWLERPAWLSAPAQGALGIVTRSDDSDTIEALQPIDDPASAAGVRAERALLQTLEGGCSAPIGALAQPYMESLRLWGGVASPDGRRLVRFAMTGRLDEPEELGRALAGALVERGAGLILEELHVSGGGAR